MPKKKSLEEDANIELLQKMLVFQLYTLEVPQERIAKTVGRQTAWVNELLKRIPKGGKSDANQAKAKKAKKRSRS
jgi:hypothetical protein